MGESKGSQEYTGQENTPCHGCNGVDEPGCRERQGKTRRWNLVESFEEQVLETDITGTTDIQESIHFKSWSQLRSSDRKPHTLESLNSGVCEPTIADALGYRNRWSESVWFRITCRYVTGWVFQARCRRDREVSRWERNSPSIMRVAWAAASFQEEAC